MDINHSGSGVIPYRQTVVAGIPSPSKIAEANLRNDDGGGPIFLPLLSLSLSLSLSLRGKVERKNGGRHIQNGFLMGGNHSAIIRMTLSRNEGRP